MSPEIQEWSHKSRSRINNLYLLTRPILSDDNKRLLRIPKPGSQTRWYQTGQQHQSVFHSTCYLVTKLPSTVGLTAPRAWNRLPTELQLMRSSTTTLKHHLKTFLFNSAGVKVGRNAVPRPGNLSLERFGCKITGFHSRNPRSWAQQVSSLRYSNLIVNESFKFHILRSQIHDVECFYKMLQNWKKNMKLCLIHSVNYW